MTTAAPTPQHVPEFARLRHLFDCPADPTDLLVAEIRRRNGRPEHAYGFGRCCYCEQVGLVPLT